MARKKIEELLKFVGIEDEAFERVGRLNGGQKPMTFTNSKKRPNVCQSKRHTYEEDNLSIETITIGF